MILRGEHAEMIAGRDPVERKRYLVLGVGPGDERRDDCHAKHRRGGDNFKRYHGETSYQEMKTATALRW
ncbi:MAG: hypothetical protein WBE90_06430, partial [Xanthobacteraceae bacterium]